MSSQNGTHECKFKRSSRENNSPTFEAVYYFLCCPFIHCYLTMEGNYCLKFDQHSTIPYIVGHKPTHNDTCEKLAAELWRWYWRPHRNHDRSFPLAPLVWGLPNLCLDRIVPIEPLWIHEFGHQNPKKKKHSGQKSISYQSSPARPVTDDRPFYDIESIDDMIYLQKTIFNFNKFLPFAVFSF